MPPTLVLPGIVTINVTNVDLTMLGYGYIAEARDALTDMHALITCGEERGGRALSADRCVGLPLVALQAPPLRLPGEGRDPCCHGHRLSPVWGYC